MKKTASASCAAIFACLLAAGLAPAQDAPDPAKKPSPADTVRRIMEKLKERALRDERLKERQHVKPGKCGAGMEKAGARARIVSGEALYYLVSVKEIPVGKAVIKVVENSSKDGRKTIKTTASGRTNSFFSNVHRVHATMSGEEDAVFLGTIAFEEEIDEKDIARRTRYEKQPGGMKIVTEAGGRKTEETVTGDGVFRDFFSVFHHVRTLPLNNGDKLCYEARYSRLLWKVSGSVKGRERVQTPVGFFNAIVLEGTVVRVDTGMSRPIKVWISDDKSRVPVKISTPTALGETTVEVSYIKRPGKQGGEGFESEMRFWENSSKESGGGGW